MCCMVIPLAIMVVSSILMLRQMHAVTGSLSTSMHQRNQEKRNRSISIMLMGIIMLLVICHSGDMILNCYNVYKRLIYNETADYNEQWIKIFIIINNTLAVINSSLNFAIYCKDLLFRQCARKVYKKYLRCTTDESETVGLSANDRGMTATGVTSCSSEAKPIQNKATFRSRIAPD